MKPRLRYLSALLVNVALPWLAYRLALPHWGVLGALIASALPLIAWMSWDLLKHRHFDALSAIVLVGIVLSLLAMAADGDTRMRSLESPMVSGMVGVSFLVSLLLPRPLVFYLARSTMSREDPHSADLFGKHWRERPTLAAYIRLMTWVWGLGMTGENILRTLILWQWPDESHAAVASSLLGYSVYAALTLWTFWCRRLIKRDALRYPPDTDDAASARAPSHPLTTL
ncbi:VC0807 family protein [Paraburkholderia sp. BCC1884]|uniref:VC0807 family protein n=1 Tax=Paraburkholderia sp. BCC1884 TaxID=2562668 RepID=UPI0011834774|nr:VC0807 family protein [Paraburkholderia sp. BCC1884]